MDYSKTYRDEICIVSLKETFLTQENSKLLKSIFVQECHLGTEKFVLDLSAVESIDAGGVGVIISIIKIIAMPENIALYVTEKSILEIFHLIKLSALVRIHSNLEELLKAFEKANA